MIHKKKKCGCESFSYTLDEIMSYTLDEIMSGKVKPQKSKFCAKHKKEIVISNGSPPITSKGEKLIENETQEP